MQTNFLPWVQPTFGWFIGLIFIFSLMGLGVHRLHPTVFFYWQSASTSCWNFYITQAERPLIRRKKGLSHDLETGVATSRATLDEVRNRNPTTSSMRMETFNSVASTIVIQDPQHELT